MSDRLPGVLGLPGRWWRRSLPFRVVVGSLVASALILALTGWSLLVQAHQGMLQADTASATAEVTWLLRRGQAEVLAVPRPEARARAILMGQEALGHGAVGDQYYVVMEGTGVQSPGIDPASVPQDMRSAMGVAAPVEVSSAFATLRFTDGRPARDGLVVAGVLGSDAAGRYPVYFLFPLTQEQEVLDVIKRTAFQSALVLVPLLTLLLYAISLQVLRPLREARRAVQSIARGELDRRMEVVGSEDEAALARSVNHMAEQLSARLGELEAMSLQQHQFVSDVAHELRTPLTTVRMAADVIYEARDEFSPVMARSAELLSREVDRFEALLHDLLDLSRIDSGAAVLTAEDVDISQLVQEEIRSQRPLADTYGSEVRFDGPDECLVSGDAIRIRRIVTNLLSNAIEHGETRPIDVYVRGNETCVAIAVRDHGVGMSEEDQSQAFTRFWRADPSRYRRVGGSGLGLAIALENAELHGGTLDVWGRPGEGAQFRLLLPVTPGAALGVAPWPRVPPDSGEPATGSTAAP